MGQIIGRHLNSYLVTGQDFDEIHTELAGNVGQNDVAVADIHIEHGVRQRIGYDAFNLNYVVLCQVVNLLRLILCIAGLKPGFFGDGEYFRLPVGDVYSIFIVRREFSVSGDGGPAIFQNHDIIDALIHHRLNRQCHTGK